MFGFNRFSCFRAMEEFMFYAETAENRTMTNLMSPMTTLNIFLHIYNFFSRVDFKTIYGISHIKSVFHYKISPRFWIHLYCGYCDMSSSHSRKSCLQLCSEICQCFVLIPAYFIKAKKPYKIQVQETQFCSFKFKNLT